MSLVIISIVLRCITFFLIYFEIIYCIFSVIKYLNLKQKVNNNFFNFLFDWEMSKNNLENKLLSNEFSDEEKFEIKEKILNEDNLRTVNYTKKLSFIINDIDNLKKNFKKNSYIIIAITLICVILMWVIYFCTK
ncbi:MAG: hypothetical protein ACI4ON_00120 [Clostridia bacterium]